MNVRPDVHARITDKIIAELEKGVLPWRKPWNADHLDTFGVALPLRSTGQSYRGINVFTLWYAAATNGYQCRYWFTFNQVKALGGNVRKGQHGETVVFAAQITKKTQDAAGEDVENKFSMLKGYTVFNGDQCDGLPAKYFEKKEITATPRELHEASETFFKNTGALFTHGGNKAFYAPSGDFIRLPPPETFETVEAYTATKAHELVHWSGGAKRLDRQFGKRFGDDAYAVEELVAELGAAFLCADLGVAPEVRADHAQYIGHWLKVLKADKRAIVQAASKAQEAADYLHGLQKGETASFDESNDDFLEPVGMAA